MTHDPRAGLERYHDPDTDVTERKRPTPQQREVLDALGWGTGAAWERFSVGDWEHIDAIVRWGEKQRGAA